MADRRPTHVRVPARVGLVGNPSDGFGGAVLAAVVDTWAADVTARAYGDGVRVRTAADAPFELADADDLAAARARDGGAHAVVLAALQSLERHLGGLPPVDVEWSSTIPRSVGLAGSSAIAVGVIEAVSSFTARPLDPRVVAALALEAETVGLGIAAGWQDRIVQAHRCAVLVDASETTTVGGRDVPVVQPIDGFDVDVLIGWRATDAESSGTYHRELRRRATDAAVTTGMRALADLARAASMAASSCDVPRLAELVDASWRTRCECAPLGPAHAQLVETVRATGLAATSPGSGGSVVALASDRASLDAAVAALSSAGASTVITRLR